MKVALFGSSGLLGFAVKKELFVRNHSCVGYSKRESESKTIPICLSDRDAIIRNLLDTWPDAVINCAAISSPDTVDRDKSFANVINVDGAVLLAEISAHLGARYIHVSTDMVFDGTSSPYRSTDMPNPSNEYGRQKLDAEKRILSASDENLVVLRITLINGNSPSGKRSPHEKVLRTIARGERMTLFDDEIRQPCSAENVASVIVELLERPNLNGLFHWAGKEEISRYELGLKILEHFGFEASRIQKSIIEEFFPKSTRPSHLSFELAPLVGKLKTKPQSIDQQIEGLLLPPDLFDWHRQNADDPSKYIHKF